MRPYELTVLRRVGGDHATIQAFAEEKKAAIEAKGGTVVAVDTPSAKRLAYPIKNETEGSYVTFAIQAEDADIREVKRQIDLDEDTLRSLLLRVPSLDVLTKCRSSEGAS